MHEFYIILVTSVAPLFDSFLKYRKALLIQINWGGVLNSEKSEFTKYCCIRLYICMIFFALPPESSLCYLFKMFIKVVHSTPRQQVGHIRPIWTLDTTASGTYTILLYWASFQKSVLLSLGLYHFLKQSTLWKKMEIAVEGNLPNFDIDVLNVCYC